MGWLYSWIKQKKEEKKKKKKPHIDSRIKGFIFLFVLGLKKIKGVAKKLFE